jgi:endonuclease-3
VRRVFLRTGIAQYDDMGHMLEVARRFHPERPGVLDEPAWRIGCEYCHAGIPDCGRCPIGDVCPKLIGTAAGVRGN